MSSARNLYHRVEELPNSKNVMRTIINYYANGLERRTCPRCASFSGGGGTRTLESLADDSTVVPLLRGEHTAAEVDRSNVKRSRSSVTPEQIERFRRVSRTAAPAPAPAPPPNTSNNSDDRSSTSGSQASTPNESESTQDPSSAADSNTNTPLRQQSVSTPAPAPPAERRRRISAIISPLGFVNADGANDVGRRSPTGEREALSLSPSPPFQSPSAEQMPNLQMSMPVRPRILLEDRSISSVLNESHSSNDLDMLEPPSAASTHSPTPLEESRSEFGSSLDISSASTPSLYARTPEPDASGCDCARSSSALGLQLNAPDGDSDDAEKVALSVEEKVFTLHDSHDSFFSTSNCLAVFLVSLYHFINLINYLQRTCSCGSVMIMRVCILANSAEFIIRITMSSILVTY